MRGRIGDGNFAHIDLRDYRRQLDYADAVKQLGIRLATIGWFVQVCCNVHTQNMRLVGRFIVPKSSLGANFVASDQKERAAREWNYSWYVQGIDL